MNARALLIAGLAFVALGARAVPERDPVQFTNLPELDELQRWHEEKARLGPTFAGSPAWQAHLDWLEREFVKRGIKDISRQEVPYTRWFTSDDVRDGQWSLTLNGEAVTVAAYWAYSGSTAAVGITAPLVYYDKEHPPADIAGRIVVFDVARLPKPLPPEFQQPAHEFTTATRPPRRPGIAMDQWYQVNYPTRFGRFGDILKQGGAAGGIVIFDMNPGRTRGLYTFPLLNPEPVGVPGLYLDRVAGAPVREAAKAGKPATLRLIARQQPAKPYFLSGFLPGRNYGTDHDEIVLLVTHTDGPNLSQENGALGILALTGYFSKLPQADRPRTILVLLDPQHYMPGRHLVDWYKEHPDIASRIVASIGVEQLGQREYDEDGDDLLLTGRTEQAVIFVQDNNELVHAAIAAVKAGRLPRTEIRVPARGQGQWTGPGDVAVKRHIPGFATSTDMSAYWSTAPGIESFDRDLCRRQLVTLTRLTQFLLDADLATIAVK